MTSEIKDSGWRYRIAYQTWFNSPASFHLPAHAYPSLDIGEDKVEISQSANDGFEAYRQLNVFIGELAAVQKRILANRAVCRHHLNHVTTQLRAAE